MRWTIDGDVLAIAHPDGVEVGTLPSGVGLERLRWTGTKLVDLADLTEIWVHPSSLQLHAVDVGGCTLVAMAYDDRRRLVQTSTGGVRLGTVQESVDNLRMELHERLDRTTERTIKLWPTGDVRYGSDKQSTLLAVAVQLDAALAASDLDDATRSALQARRRRINDVWSWIATVIAYRDQQQAALDAALTEQELEGIARSWDFSQFNDTDPDVRLAEVMP